MPDSFQFEYDAERTTRLIDRLVELTSMNQLMWAHVYPDETGMDYSQHGQEFFGAISAPSGFVVEDLQHGFGFVSFQLKDPSNEEYDPSLFVAGTKIPATPDQLALLRDAIMIYMEDVQQGRAPNQQTRLDEVVGAAVAPYSEELQRLRFELDNRAAITARQIDVLEKQALALVYMSMPAGAPDPMARTAPQVTNTLPLTPNTLRHALRYLLQNGDSAQIPEHTMTEVVQRVVADHAKGLV